MKNSTSRQFSGLLVLLSGKDRESFVEMAASQDEKFLLASRRNNPEMLLFGATEMLGFLP